MELCGESVRETERFAVTAAAGALGPVLKKLSSLLGDEYRLQEGTRRDIESIKSELEPVHDLLGKLWGRFDLDVACKEWMAEARELSYDMEDDIDSFTEGLERGGDAGSFIPREATDSPFKEFMERVKDVSKQCGKMQKIGDAICNRSKLTTDPRALFLHKDASELVGMEKEEEDLIGLLTRYEMVCILGLGGMGKTTLADLVYHAAAKIQCRAFVSLHPNPNMTEILSTILSQVTNGAVPGGSGTEPATEQNMVTDISISLPEKSCTEPAAEQNDIIKAISTFLSDKSYLVIVDDIWHWEVWQVIRKALPKNNRICRVIMTTRVHSIAEKCESEHGAGVCRPSFAWVDAERLSDRRLSESVEATNAKGLSTKIADMCGEPPFYCCPLAVICLSSAWAESQPAVQQGGDGALDAWASHVMGDGFLSTPSLKPLVQSLCLGFDDLPLQLKTCLLYCTIHTLGCWVLHDREFLVRSWVAEGFASRVEVAEAYLEELVSRNLLRRRSRGLTVDPIIQAFLICKAKEDNFITYYNEAGNSSHAKLQIRRLCLDEDRYLDEDVVSHTRTLVVSRRQRLLDGVPFKAFKKLRVLEIKSIRLENGHLVDICGLIWLRYLVLNGCPQITVLPREIGKLQKLETLHMAGTHISKLPTEIGKLKHLETLDISGTEVVELPTCIEELQSLKTLNVSGTMVRELPMEIRKLKHLRTLDMRRTEVRELPCPWEVQNSINVHVGDFHSVKMVQWAGVVSPDRVISSSSGANYRRALSIMLFDPLDERCEKPLQVPLLRVAGRHMKVPQWVKQDLCNVCSLDISLCKLGEDDLEFLKRHMPNLQALALRLEVLPREPVAITRGGFSKLETFYVDCRLPRVITFKEGAMPKLKQLEFKFYTGTASQDYSMGIAHLHSLESIEFRCSEHYSSDGPGIRATIDAVRNEIAKHPNEEIRLWVNDDNVFVRHARDKEKKALMEAEERRKSQLMAAEKRAQQDKYRGRGGIRS